MADKSNCAWCLYPGDNDGKRQQNEGDSHGICKEHSDALLYNFYVERFNRVPSYVEQNAYAFAHENEEAEV